MNLSTFKPGNPTKILALFLLSICLLPSCTPDKCDTPIIKDVRVCSDLRAGEILCSSHQDVIDVNETAIIVYARFECITKETNVKFVLYSVVNGQRFEIGTYETTPQSSGANEDADVYNINYPITRTLGRPWNPLDLEYVVSLPDDNVSVTKSFSTR